MLSASFWKKYFQVYDILNSAIPYQELLDKIIKEAGIKEGDIVLDVGCGTGNFELRLRNTKPELDIKVVGIANSPDGLEIYKKKLPQADVKLVELITGIPFPDNYFNKIIANNVLFTIAPEKRTEIFRELYRVLKPGGVLVLSNIRYGWAPINIYREHIKKSIKKNGFWFTIMAIFKELVPTLKMFYYNFYIEIEGESGECRYMDDGEQVRKLVKAGFKNIGEEQYVYANQAILIRAEK